MLRGLNSARTPATRCSRLDCDIRFPPLFAMFVHPWPERSQGRSRHSWSHRWAADSRACLPYSPGLRTTMIRGNAIMLPRRRFLSLAAGAVAAPAVSRIARAQAYPSRPITMVVPYGGGGPADGVARPLAERMAAALGQPIVIENIGGESGTTGVTRAVRAAADGYTLSFGHHGSHVVNGAIFPLPFDLRSDLEPIALLPSNPLLISARKDLPAASLKDLIAWLKANPEKVSTASAGAGSGTYVNAVYFQNAAGVSFEFVPHQSVQTSIRALIAGELDVLFDQASNSLPHLRAGRIKSLAVTSSARTQSAPEVPTTDEAGLPDFHSATWY